MYHIEDILRASTNVWNSEDMSERNIALNRKLSVCRDPRIFTEETK